MPVMAALSGRQPRHRANAPLTLPPSQVSQCHEQGQRPAVSQSLSQPLLQYIIDIIRLFASCDVVTVVTAGVSRARRGVAVVHPPPRAVTTVYLPRLALAISPSFTIWPRIGEQRRENG
jgi:hypothetical protein